MDKVATRDGFGKGLLKLKDRKDIVVMDAGCSDSTRTQEFGRHVPERFFNMGISEGDMICAAAGFAKCNKTVFAAGFSCFLLGRTMDQITVSIAYSNSNVKIVGSHAGLATGEDGPTAQIIQDVAWLRSMPNMTIISPADGLEAEKATIALASHIGPAYLRVTRPAVQTITKDEPFVIGKAKALEEGDDVTIIGSGPILSEALEAAKCLRETGINPTILNMATIKPLDVEAVRAAAAKTGAIVTVEDHSIYGGLGSAVAEVLSEQPGSVLERIGVKDTFAESGSGPELYKKYGLDAHAICDAAKRAVQKKVTISA